jgi:hypothetical protein
LDRQLPGEIGFDQADRGVRLRSVEVNVNGDPGLDSARSVRKSQEPGVVSGPKVGDEWRRNGQLSQDCPSPHSEDQVVEPRRRSLPE